MQDTSAKAAKAVINIRFRFGPIGRLLFPSMVERVFRGKTVIEFLVHLGTERFHGMDEVDDGSEQQIVLQADRQGLKRPGRVIILLHRAVFVIDYSEPDGWNCHILSDAYAEGRRRNRGWSRKCNP